MAVRIADVDIGEHDRRRIAAARRSPAARTASSPSTPPNASRPSRSAAYAPLLNSVLCNPSAALNVRNVSLLRSNVGEALVRAEPEPAHRILADRVDRAVRQSVARQPAREAHVLAVHAVDAVEAELRADPDRAVRAFVDRAHDVAGERARIGRILAEHVHVAPAASIMSRPFSVPIQIAAVLVLMQREHGVAAEPRRAGVRAQHLPVLGRRVEAREAVRMRCRARAGRRARTARCARRRRRDRSILFAERQHRRAAARRIEQRDAAIRRDPEPAESRAGERGHAQLRRSAARVPDAPRRASPGTTTRRSGCFDGAVANACAITSP